MRIHADTDIDVLPSLQASLKMTFLIKVLDSLGVSGDASSFFDVSRIK